MTVRLFYVAAHRDDGGYRVTLRFRSPGPSLGVTMTLRDGATPEEVATLLEEAIAGIRERAR